MPKKVRIIGANAFGNLYVLQPIDFSETKIMSVGTAAFFNSFACNETSYPILHLPGTLYEVGQQAFQNIFRYDQVMTSGINTLQFGGEGDPSILNSVG